MYDVAELVRVREEVDELACGDHFDDDWQDSRDATRPTKVGVEELSGRGEGECGRGCVLGGTVVEESEKVRGTGWA